MKKTILTLFIVLLVVVVHAQITFTATFSPSNLSLDTIKAADSNIYTKVKLANYYDYTINLGEPELPTRTIQLIIPSGKVVSEVNATNIQTHSFNIKQPVYPVDSCGVLSKTFISPNATIYGANNVYPHSAILNWNQDCFDGNNIVYISVCPFEYYPSVGLLKLITSISIRIDYSSGNLSETFPLQRLRKTQDVYDSLLYHLVDNPWDISLYQTRPTIVDKLGQTSTGLPVYEYVVVAPQVFEAALHDFVTWKNQKGYRTGIVHIEDILEAYPNGDIIGSNPIQDAAGSLRQYLYDAYKLGTFYALLVGDPNPANNSTVSFTWMPYRYGSIVENPGQTGFNTPTTDWYFSDLSGDWNGDNDDYYGETTGDTPSFTAEIMVGRLICTSTQEIRNWITKLLIYEKNPGNGNAGYVIKSLVSLADHLGTQQYWENLPDFSHTIMEEDPDCLSPNPIHPLGSEVISRLNNDKVGLWTWINHGGTNTQHSCMLSMTANIDNNVGDFSRVWKVYSDSLCVDNATEIQPDTHHSLDYLTNYNEPSIIYGTSCHVIPFDINKSNSLTGSRNCGESFTVGGSYGGVAFLGNTQDAIASNYYLHFATTLNSVSENTEMSHIGILETQSKNHCTFWREHHYKHNLIGDPECQIWTKVPSPLQFDYFSQNMFLKEVTNSVEICVSGFSYPNSGNCTITLYSEDDIYKTITVPIGPLGTAVAVFDSIFPSSNSPVSVTATCYNHLPAQSYIPVTEMCQLNITSNETWSGTRTVNCDVIVQENAILTITGTVSMNVNNKIKVLPGGSLVLDGGKITCAVQDYQWQGVRVLGTGSGSWQGTINNHFTQGYVCIMNGAEINDARVAIDLWDGINYETTGGIANVSDATFHNNGIGIRALCFKNKKPNSNKESAYKATVKNSSFLIDENYPTQGAIFKCHMDLFKVRGILVQGCVFSIEDCPEGLSEETNCAIFVHDGSCQIFDYCSNNNYIPCLAINYTKSFFLGFDIGINAINDVGYNSALTVKNSVFSNNTIGIRTLNDVNTTILFSDFNVGNDDDCGIGIYLEKTPDFCIEENTFRKAENASPNVDCYGIVVDHSQSSNDIYRNSFSNLTCANYAMGSNCKSIDEGLTYRCNDNTSNGLDIYVPTTSFIIYSYYGISPYQGSSTIPAGNTFSQTGVQWQIYNGAHDPITYFYNANNPPEEPQSSFINNVRKMQLLVSNECASNYDSNGSSSPNLPPSDRQQKENDYYNSYINYQGVKRLYDNYIDGGNTHQELSNISVATSENMWELRSELLGLSPYLSQQVLLAFIEKDDVFPQSVIFEVLASNPEELSRDSLLSIVESNETLPEYMINVLREVAKGEGTYRSVLESQMSMYKHSYYKAAKDVVRSIVNDTVFDNNDLRLWLSNMNNINADRQIIASYMEDGNDSIAFALARILPSLYELSDIALAEHNGYMELLTIYDSLYRQGRTVFEMDAGELAIIDSLMINGTGITQSLAKSIHEAVSGTSSVDCPEIWFPSGSDDRGGYIPLQKNLNNNFQFNVSLSPNPAKTWVEVNYTLPADLDEAQLTIYGALGSAFAKYDLNGNTGNKIIDLRGLNPGVYTYSVCSGKQIKTGKLVIVR